MIKFVFEQHCTFKNKIQNKNKNKTCEKLKNQNHGEKLKNQNETEKFEKKHNNK